jgi:hypothetical protein
LVVRDYNFDRDYFDARLRESSSADSQCIELSLKPDVPQGGLSKTVQVQLVSSGTMIAPIQVRVTLKTRQMLFATFHLLDKLIFWPRSVHQW